MDICIFCKKEHWDTTVEHIVPRTLGNYHYILPRGKVCGQCNNRFSRYENKVLSSLPFIKERALTGRVTVSHLKDRLRMVAGKDEIPMMDRVLLKMGYEALYKSRRKIWEKYSFDDLLALLVQGHGSWTYQLSGEGFPEMSSLPGFINTFRLKMNRLELKYKVVSPTSILFGFRYGNVRAIIDLLSPVE